MAPAHTAFLTATQALPLDKLSKTRHIFSKQSRQTFQFERRKD
ncbi:hypothetical protein RB2083_1829 [Rhodobacteraceae bacterium HTCC2083]|nr:hypothetical protein RB2083_1829 [Rhodobacteraceae bacterium HTCC2083]